MKHKVYLLALILLLTPFLIFSQTVLVNDDFSSMNGWKASYGNWKIVDGRLAQLSTTAGKAKIDRYVPQSGLMQYEFNVHYIDGGLDNYAGFGIHVFIDKPAKGISWGDGNHFFCGLPTIRKHTAERACTDRCIRVRAILICI